MIKETNNCLILSKAHCDEVEMNLLNTHLESTYLQSDVRVAQLEHCFNIMMNECPLEKTVILGGDLNLRDWELGKIGGLPAGVQDAWEMLGSDPRVKFDISYIL